MKGFTLIEILVVMAVTVIMAGILIANFNRSSVDLNQTRLLVQDAIREAQALALSGAVFRGEYRCGYGIHFESQSYVIYAGPVADDVVCGTIDTNYDTGDGDVPVRTGIVPNTHIQISGPDIFYAPPKPTTFIDNSSSPGSADIVISRNDASCNNPQGASPDCRFINVSTSGLINSK